MWFMGLLRQVGDTLDLDGTKDVGAVGGSKTTPEFAGR
jgi:hypothetical protein